MESVIWKCLPWWVVYVSLAAAFEALPQPHIVFIMVDDMGWNDVSYHGSDQILTPNIDTLALHGVCLQQFYSEAICTPARTALLTGKYPMRLGMHGLPLYNGEDRGIPVTERLLPSYLKDLGYSTHLVGKWHVGMSKKEFLPTSRGYDSHYGLRGGLIDYYTHEKVELWPNGRLVFGLDLFDNDVPQEDEERYIIDAFTDRAINLIKSHNTSKPMFLHLAHNAPHSGNDGGLLQPPLNQPVKNIHIANSDRRLYASIINHLDQSIGQVITALGEKDMLENTIIVFQSDNGAPTTGMFANWGINLPFRGKKYTPWEGGVRVPAIIWHSSLVPKVWHGLMHITDWLPTLVAAAGGEVTSFIDGVNHWESLKDPRGVSQRKEVLIAIEPDIGYAAYRAGDYKIVVGNVSNVPSDFYGADFLANKEEEPDYIFTMTNCEAAKMFETIRLFRPPELIQAMRSAAAVRQLDPVRDSKLCVPTPSKGCLFNVHRDPTETHDLWYHASNIATLLTARLRALYSQQVRRPRLKIDDTSDPANFNYVWTPWIDNNDTTSNLFIHKLNEAIEEELRNKTDADLTVASVIDCGKSAGFTNLLCLLRKVF